MPFGVCEHCGKITDCDYLVEPVTGMTQLLCDDCFPEEEIDDEIDDNEIDYYEENDPDAKDLAESIEKNTTKIQDGAEDNG